MSGTETACCRLCAKSRPYNKLFNLQKDEDRRRKILCKLERLSIKVNLNSDDNFPKTVCLTCVDSLAKAVDFVLSVESAQKELFDTALSYNIKQESSETEPSYDSGDDICESTVKAEDDSTVSFGYIKSDVTGTQEKYSCTDSIPLSQLKLSWKDYTWTCAHCSTNFPSWDELRLHSMQYHNCCNAFRCTDCNRRKFKLDKFVTHIKRHRKHLQLSCYKCYEQFDRRIDAFKHKTVHLSSKYSCYGCNETFPNKKELNSHSKAFYKDKVRRGIPFFEESASNLTCVLCKKKVKTKGSLKTHLLTHTERNRDCICDKCGKCFFTKYELKGHMLSHEDYRPHKCKICKQGFRYQSRLKHHIEIHDGKKPFECNLCGRKFRLQKLLTNHSIIHTDSLPYTCSYCHKAFRFKSILEQHLRQHTGIKPYACQVCQREFTNWPNYNKHMKRVHSMDMSKKKRTPDGVFPTNPLTGEIVKDLHDSLSVEWKNKILNETRSLGRQKIIKVRK